MIRAFKSWGLALACVCADQSLLAKPLVAMFTTCSSVAVTTYPADTLTWFDAQREKQVVFFAHLLFPILPELDARVSPTPTPKPESWHPPLILPKPVSALAYSPPLDEHFAEAIWVAPDGSEVGYYGLTMPARVSSDYLRLQGRTYIPHTFSVAFGIQDNRLEAGQKSPLSKPGQYHIRFFVDGHPEGIAFFRVLGSSSPQAMQAPAPKAITARAAAELAR